MSNLKFICIHPNFNPNIINKFNETIFKLLNDNKLNQWNDDVKDLIDDIESFTIDINNDDPGNYIESYYKNQIDKNITLNQYYNISPFDIVDDDTYSIMITSSFFNDSTYLKKLSDEQQKRQFNLMASNMAKYYNNGLAIFGDVFIIKMSKIYYHMLFEKEITFCEKIYSNYNKFDLISTLGRVYNIQVYVKPMNKILYHPRDILNKYIIDHQYELINNKIIKIKHQDLEIYIKITEPLPDSHDYILSMATQSENKSNQYYFIDISQNDITKLT